MSVHSRGAGGGGAVSAVRPALPAEVGICGWDELTVHMVLHFRQAKCPSPTGRVPSGAQEPAPPTGVGVDLGNEPVRNPADGENNGISVEESDFENIHRPSDTPMNGIGRREGLAEPNRTSEAVR